VARPQVPAELTTHASRLIAVRPELIYPSTIPFCRNWLGEFSNAVMRADMLGVLARAELNGLSYEGLEDIGMFLTASERGTAGGWTARRRATAWRICSRWWMCGTAMRAAWTGSGGSWLGWWRGLAGRKRPFLWLGGSSWVRVELSCLALFACGSRCP
jgi:hypothetical protein